MKTNIDIILNGINITGSLKNYLLSLTYTEFEEEKADDLQFVIEDSKNIWVKTWLNEFIKEAITAPAAASLDKLYTVTASGGVNVREKKPTKSQKDNPVLGTLPYGTQIYVSKIDENYAEMTYNGKRGFIDMQYLAKANFGGSDSVETSGTDLKVGNTVIVSGKPQYSSYGTGTPGKEVTNYKGSITYLNLKSGVPYPVHVGSLGWFGLNQIKSDSVTVKQEKQENKIQGLKIQALIHNSESGILDCGQFEIDSIDSNGPPSVVTIKATALPFSSGVRLVRKSKAWESYSLEQIAKEIANKNNMACIFDSSYNPYYNRVEQYNKSDILFLFQLCKEAGISLKATNNILVLFDQKKYEDKKAVLDIKRGDSNYISYKMNIGSADKKYGKCRVSYIDPNGTKIEGIAYAEEDVKGDEDLTLEVTAKVSSVGEAKELAQRLLRRKNRYEKTASFTFIGNVNLIVGSVVTLRDWGMFDGRYIISESKHSVGSGGYKTQIKLRSAEG